jgi:nitrate/nitrite transporter NarK
MINFWIMWIASALALLFSNAKENQPATLTAFGVFVVMSICLTVLKVKGF